MEPLAVYSDASLVEQGCTYDFELDLANGIGNDPENDFEVALPESVRLEPGSVFRVDGTGFGGYVIERVSDTTEKGVLRWCGRTWFGMLADRCLVPDSGQARVTVQGTIAYCLGDLFERLGLDELFIVGDCPVTPLVSYSYGRYPDGLTALIGMLSSVNMRPVVEVFTDGGVTRVAIGAAEAVELDSVADGEVMEVKISRTFTPPNHIIALGEGENEQRIVLNYYADSSGNVSTTKTIGGLAERVIIYDYNNVDAEQLAEAAIDRLTDEQVFGEVTVALPDGVEAPLGDYVVGYDSRVDESVRARVEKQIVKVKRGVLTVETEAGGVL